MKQRAHTRPRRQKLPRKSGIEFQKLEDRILFSGTPAVTVDAPTEVKIGEAATVTVTFDNTDAADAGYGPWVDVFIDATGTDGVVDPADPSNAQTGDTDGVANPGDQYDGFSVTTGPTYLGSTVTNTIITLDDAANGGLGVLHPYAVDSNGDSIYINTSNPLSPYFGNLNGSFTSGDKLMVLQLPFGSFTPDQPQAEISFGLTLSDHADANTSLNITAIAGFQFGNDPLNNPATDPSIIGLPDTDSALVGVNLAELTKTYNGPENETATGANYVRTYRINVDIANGQTFTDLHIFDDLPDEIQFKQVSAASHAYTILGSPSTSVPGGDLSLRFTGAITGTSGTSDAWVDVEFYIPRVFDSDASGTLTGADASVLNPNSGADLLLDNQAYGFGTWDPIDPRDPGTIVGLKVGAGFDPTSVATALATATPDATPEHNNLEVSPLVVQKNFSTVTNVGVSGHSPGDLLEFTLDFQVSDYFAFQSLVIDDTMLDGLRFDASFVPTLQINGNTYVLTALGWAAANYTVSQNFTGAVASGNFVLDPAANDGSTALEFRISDEMVSRGQTGKLVGGGIDPGAPTGTIANDLTGYNDGATTGRVTYRAMILDEFTDTYPSGEPSLNPRDVLSNSATITGEVLDLSSGPALTPYAGPVLSADDSAESLTIAQDQVHKTIYAVNGNTNLNLFQDTSGNINLQPGDVVTYRFTYTIPSGDIENLRFTDFLPLPVFDVDDINADNTNGGLGEWNFVDNTANVAVSNFTPGVITYGPTHTLHTVTGPAGATPILSIDSVTNSVKMQWDDFVNTVNNSRRVDILLSATVSSDPFADGLFLTNQVQSGEGNTQSPGSESLANAIIQIVLNQPDVSIYKGVVASSQGGAVGPVGGLTFDSVGGAGFTGTLAGLTNAAAIGALNLDATTDVDAGDLVRFALVAFNKGRSDAFDVRVQDTVVGSYVSSYANKAAFMAATNFNVLRGDGTVLTEGADYTLTWDSGTKTFQVEMTDSYIAGNTAGDVNSGGLSRGYQPGVDADVTNGSNAIIVLYDLTVDTDAQASSTVTNTAYLTNFAGDEGALDHTAENKFDEASVVIDSPGFTKVLTTTSVTPVQDPNNALNQAVVGELVTYTFTISVGEGTTAGVSIVDTMDAGFAFVDVVSTTYSVGVTSTSSIGLGSTPANVTVGNSGAGTGNLLTFQFGDITNTDVNNATDETITVTYRAVVLNTNAIPASPGNQAGTPLNNSAEFSWSWVNDPDDPLVANPEGSSSISSSAANVTVIEPSLTMDLSAAATDVPANYTDALTSVDAGDFVYYRIRISNAAGGAIAYDTAISSVLPSQLGSFTVVSTALTNASGGAGGSLALTDGGGNTLDVTDFAFAGSTLGLAGGRNLDLGADSRLEIIVRGTLDYTVTPTQSLANTASATWTSIDGTPGAVSVHNANSTERTGAGGTGADASVLNNYATSDPTAVAIVAPTSTKSLIATSESFTTFVSGTERVAIGEIVRYRLLIQIPEGTLPDLQIVDALPTGLLFINDGTAMVGFISDTNAITSSALSGAGLDLGTAIAQPTFVLTDTAVSKNQTTDDDSWDAGNDPRFKLGTIVNTESDANAEYIVFEFNAVVLNTANTGNQNNTQLANTFTTRINGNTQVGATSNSVNLRVAEPNLTIAQIASTAGPLDAGDTLTYTITVTNNSNTAFSANAAPAFDVRIQDALDAIAAANPSAELEFLSYSLGALPVGTSLLADASSTVTDTLDLTFNRLDAGQSITITVNAQLKTGALAAAEIESKAVATYTSLPGTAGTTDGTIATTYGTTDVDLNPGTDSTLASALAGTTVTGGTLTTLTANAAERTGADSESAVIDNTPPANSAVRNNYAVAASAPAGLLVASPTIDKTFQEGSISADDTSVATSTLANAVIGETVTYDILVTLPEGVIGNLRVQDLIPAGLRIDSMQILTTAASTSLLAADFNGSFATTPTLPAPVSGSSTVTFDFDDVTVAADNVGNNNSFVLRVVATVENILANQATVTRTNTANLVFNDPDGTGNSGPAADRTVADANAANDPTITVVEPTLSILKTVSGAVADAGDPITYTITISNSSGQAAYDVLLSDILDSALTSPSLTSVVATGFGGGTFLTPTLADFEITVGGTLQIKPAFDLDMNDGSQIVITISATLANSVTTGQVVTNKSDVSWTSTDGANPDERDGTGDPAPDSTTPDPAILNNYAVSSVVTTTAIANPVVSHSIIDTSHAGTTGNNVTIGEIVTYRVTVTLPEGVTPTLDIDVALPAGIAYIPGTILLDGSHPDETSLDDAHAGSGTSAFNGTGLVAPTATRIAGAGNFQNGDDVRFSFGSITTAGDNVSNNNTFSFTYQALVLDVVSNDGKAPGLTALTPTGTWDAGTPTGSVLVDTTSVGNPLARGVTATVVEPELNITKVASITSGDAGNAFTYTLTVNHTAASQANAYNLQLDDVIPGAFVPTGFTALIGVTDVSSNFTLTGNTFATDADGLDLLLSESLSIVFTGNISSTQAPGTTFNNSVTLGYNTLPDGATAQQGDFISDVSGVDDGTDRERQTADTDSDSVTVPSTLSFSKSLLSTDVAATTGTNFSIGETGTFRLAVTLQQGLTSRVTLNDDLPSGLDLQSGTLIFRALTAGTTAVGFVSNTVYTDGSVIDAADISYVSGTGVLSVSLKNVQIPATGSTATGQFAVEYQAKASNVTGSDNGDILTNSASASADRNGDGDTADGGETSSPSTVSITIVEPELVIDKSIITSTTGIDAGDTVTYQIVVSHLGSSTADAYDLILDDILPAAALENFTLVSAVISDGATNTNVVGSFNLTGAGVLSTTGDIDLRLNTNGTNDQVLTILVSTTVKDALNVGTSFTNTADIKWSSLDGGLDGDDAGTTGERTGGGANPPNDYSASDSVAATTVGMLGVTKAVDQANATIGEVVTYTVTVTVAEGQTVLNLADTLPAGLTLVANSVTLTSPLGWTISGFNTNSASQTLTVSNPGGSGATANNAATTDSDTFTYTYQAVVTNVLGNQAGTALVNDLDSSADLTNDGDTSDAGETDNNNTATVTVVEPRVTIDKTASPTSGLNAGDVVTYTVTLTNAGPAATSKAFDVLLSDTVPSGILITGITSTALAGGATTDSATTITGGGTGLGGQYDIPVGGSVTIIYTATIQTTIVPGQSLVNDADATFSSLDGSVVGERTGGGVAEPTSNAHPDDGTTLNNYGVGDAITVTALSYAPLVHKALVSTSEASSTGADVLVGEIVRYLLKFELFEGTLGDLVIQDLLPPGLQFLNDGTATFTTLNVATSVTNTLFAARDSSTGAGTTFADGTDIFFQLGDLVNSDNDADVEYGVIEFNAIILNTASNQDAVTLNNSFAVLYDADNNGATAPTASSSLRVDANDDGTAETTGQSVSNTVTATVREAALSFNQVIPAGVGYDAGDTFSITYTITNSGSVPAFNVRLADLALPPEFNLTAISFTNTGTGGSVTDATDLGTDTIDAEISQIAAGSTWTVTATITLRNSVNPGDVYTNPADVTFTSLPGTNGTTGNTTGSDTPGAVGTATGERTGADGVGGALNDYALADTESLTVPAPFSVTKAANKATATIGEVVTYTVTVTVIEGTTTNIVLNDTLPSGMSFVAGSATITNASGMTISGFDANALDQTLTSVVNPGASDSTGSAATGTFTYTYQAVVLDVAGNDGLTAAGDGDGQTSLINDLDASADGVSSDNDNTATVTVVEPRLQITKANNDADGVVVRGQVITYTLTIANLAGNGSTATAYDVRVRDLVPASLALTLGSINVSGATLASNSSAGNTLDLTLDSLALGSTATITFTATVGAGVVGGDLIDNNAKVFYDSLPDNEGTAPGTGNTVFGDPDGTSGDRDYGSTGPDEAPTPVADDIHQDTDRLTVGSFTLGDRVWFDVDGDGVQDGSEIGIGGVTVTLLYAGNDGIFGNADDVSMGTVDTTAGAYLFSNLANGNYRVTLDPADLADAASSVETFDLDGVGTLHTTDVTIAGSHITTADFGYRGTSTISDTVFFDANNDGDQDAGEVGLSGIDVTARWAGDDGILDTADDLVLSATTNATGNYAFANLFSGRYRIDVDQADLPVGTNATPTSGGSGSNISVGADPFTLTGATALGIGENRNTVDFGYTGTGSIGDFVFHDADADGVQDAGEFGLAGIDITLTWAGQDGTLGNADDVISTTTTNSSGGYIFPNLAAGVFSVNLDQADLPAGLTTLTSGAGSVGSDPFATTLTAGQNRTNADFGYTGTGSIGDTVWYDADGNGTINGAEVGLSGVTVQLTWAGLDGDISTAADNLIFTDVTDSAGNYAFANLPVDMAGGANTGLYQVAVLTGTLPTGFTSATYDLDGIGTAHVASLTLTSGTPTRADADFGYRGTGALGNRVYHDTNGNGSFDAGDLGLAGVDVTLRWDGQDGIFGTADDVTRTTTTNATGSYGFTDLVAGNFRIDIDNADLPTGITTITSGGTGTDISVGTDPFTTNLTAGENDQTVDFGYRGTGSIGDKIYADIDGDGTEDAIDYGLANVGVTITWAGLDGDLTTLADNVVYTTTTNALGFYSVANLAPGSYRAAVTTGTLPAGYTVAVGDLDGGADSTADLTLANGQNRTDVDFGYKGTGSISDTVWLDSDGSSTQNALESGIAGVTLDLVFDVNNDGLFDAGDVVVTTTTTDANGNYSFTGLVPDRYLVRVTDTGNKLASATNTYDKDDYGTVVKNGLAAVELSASENDAAVDFGYQGAATLGDRVWNDRDADGVQDAGEFGVAGLTVNLYKDLNADGDYADAGEGLIATTTTGVDGAYLFGGLIAGSYIVELPAPPASATNTHDKDDYGAAANNSSAKVSLGATENDLAVDFGYQGSASVGDFVWYDADNDGVQDASEPPIPGVRIYLDIDGDGTYDAATEPTSTTNAGGIYSITGLIGGTYTARVDTSTLPAGYVATFDRDGSGSPDATTFVLGGAQNLTTVDWGYIGTLTVSGSSYHDLDKDGAFNGTDTGLGGVTIELISDTNNDGAVDGGDFIVYTTTTGANGAYSFATVISGNYLVRETQLAGYGSLENGTNLIDVTVAGASVTGLNFGNTTGSLAGRVFSDLDDSGAQNGTENGILGATVKLEWSGADNTFGTADDRSVTMTTNALGDYVFDHTNTAGFVSNGDSTAGLLSTGQYRIVETTPTGYIDGADALGNAATAAGAVTAGSESAAWLLANPASGTGRGADSMTGIRIGTAQSATGYNFGEILPSSLSGSVHEDLNGNARHDAGEAGISGNLIRLTGTDIYGRAVSTTVTTDGSGAYRFSGLYASSASGYTLSQLVQPAAYNDGLEGAGTSGGISGFEVIRQIVLGANVAASNYTFGEIVIPPVISPADAPITSSFRAPSNSSPSVLTGYFYNVFDNFLGDSEEDDEDLDYLLDAPGNEPEPILSLMPMYSGHAEPGSTIVVEIKNIRGAVIGTETIVADAGGNWLAKFPNNIVYDTPTSVMQTVTRPSYSDSPDEEFNFRTYFSPTINPSHFFTQPFDVDKVFSENSPQEAAENLEESLGESQNFDWNSFNYEFLTEPGVPSA